MSLVELATAYLRNCPSTPEKAFVAGYLSGMWRMYQPRGDLDAKVHLQNEGYLVEVYSGQQRLMAMSYAYDQNEKDPILDFLAKLTKVVV